MPGGLHKFVLLIKDVLNMESGCNPMDSRLVT